MKKRPAAGRTRADRGDRLELNMITDKKGVENNSKQLEPKKREREERLGKREGNWLIAAISPFPSLTTIRYFRLTRDDRIVFGVSSGCHVFRTAKPRLCQDSFRFQRVSTSDR